MIGREDRKSKVSPFVAKWVHDLVHDIARHRDRQTGKVARDGEAARALVLAAFHDIPTINRLAPYFWREFERGNLTWPGHNHHEDLRKLVGFTGHPVERLHIRFSKQETWELGNLQSALAAPFSHTVCSLLVMALNQERIIQLAAPGYVARSLFSLKEGSYLWR